MNKFVIWLSLILGMSSLQADDVRFHGPIIQWHRDPTTSATFSWVQRLSKKDTSFIDWREGASGFGYGDNDDVTKLDSMKGKFKRVYIAKQFTLKTKLDTGATAVLEINYDDAFVAYLNGVEVARSENIKGSHTNAKITDRHENKKTKRFAIANPEKILKAGPNLISIEGHNHAKRSSDFSLDPRFLVNGAPVIKRAEKWLYLAGRDPEAKWYLTRPEFKNAAGSVDRMQANWELLISPRNGQAKPRTVTTRAERFGDTKNPVFFAQVDGLEQETEYAFELKANGKVMREGWFRTAPVRHTKPFSFVVGGDMGTATAQPVCALAGRENVMFGYLGGDLAYANGREVWKWYDWIDNWTNLVTTADGRNLPMVAGIGNHEMKALIKKGDSLIRDRDRAPYYFSLFDLPNRGRSNFTVDFGDYMSLILLDSNHARKVDKQTKWLRQQLAARTSFPHIFPIYHRPAWGTGVKGNVKEIQKEWTPLFEEFQVSCVFENDHHVYKRTWKITNGKRDDERGILHIGDGAWGASPRMIEKRHLKSVKAQDYLAKWMAINHLVRVTVDPDGTRTYQAKIADGTIIDQFVDKP